MAKWRNRLAGLPLVVGLFTWGHADWINLNEKGPYNPELTEERGAKLQQELPVLPPLGSEPSTPRADVPAYDTDERASDELAKTKREEAERALAVAGETLASDATKRPWLMPVVGLVCAALAFGVIWWLRAWSEKNLPPMNGRSG